MHLSRLHIKSAHFSVYPVYYIHQFGFIRTSILLYMYCSSRLILMHTHVQAMCGEQDTIAGAAITRIHNPLLQYHSCVVVNYDKRLNFFHEWSDGCFNYLLLRAFRVRNSHATRRDGLDREARVQSPPGPSIMSFISH